MPEVVGLFISLRHRLPMKGVEDVRAVADRGLEGCAHAQPGQMRQVLLMDLETLEALGLEPGSVQENITTRGLRLQDLRTGQRLRVGEAQLEVTIPCEPCGRMDDIRRGLQQELRGRRGILCRVVEPGLIRRGDAVTILDARP